MERLVIALGHTFGKLDIETPVLAARGILIADGNNLSMSELAARNVEGVLLGTARKIDRTFVQALPQLKAIVRYGMGVDNIELGAATERGIVVCNVRDYCVEEVAVHVLACALALSRALPHWDANIRGSAWRAGPRPVLYRLSKCTLGIIGFGQIGRALAERAERIFGSIVFYDPWYQPAAGEQRAAAEQVDDLDVLLERADVVSVHVPLTPQTKGLLGERAFARMKPTAYVVNASRGGIVDEDQLVAAVREGRIAGAALDTFTSEPLPQAHELMHERRILLSPHIAWLSEQAEMDLREHAAAEMARVLSGEAPRSQVNAAA